MTDLSEMLFIGGGIVSFFSFKTAQKIRPTFYEERIKDDIIYRTKNDMGRLGIYGIGCIGMGLSASPIFLSIHEVSSIILPMTMGVTAAIFGGASLVGLLLPRTTMLGYRNVLTGGLLGLLGLNVSGALAAKFLGFTLFATTLSTPESYIGIGLFTLMLIYDTTVAIKRYEKGDADHLGMSIQILLDIWNLIIKIAIEIAKAKAKGKSNSNENKK
jgi:FtsH-binding integral membrane protein